MTVTRKYIHFVAKFLMTSHQVGNRHIVDATVEEEMCTATSMALGVTNRGHVLGSRKQGVGSLDPETLQEMIQV